MPADPQVEGELVLDVTGHVERRQEMLETIEHHGYLAARLVETLTRGHPGDLDLLYALGSRRPAG